MDNQVNLLKLPDITRHRIDRHQVFSDFLELAAIRISNRVDPVHYEQRNECGCSINEVYTDTEHRDMLQYLEALVSCIKDNLERGDIEDILGRLFEECGFSRNGQDQTPSGLSMLTAQLGLGEPPQVPEKGYFVLDECSCGSGALILAFAEAMLVKDLNYCTQLVVSAMDTDLRCVHMAYIQLSLYGIPAVVIHGNTLTLQEYSRWYTPMYIINKWVWRNPFTLAGEKSPVDEMLKRMTEPLYRGIRQAQELLGI